ncbi:MAG: ComEC/Rec2 family competence protein [Candidatus Omnitrophica bacterium]|nr:ComEC/Rec2 family competence protein [Candidatus Omnitrophota bacterium]
MTHIFLYISLFFASGIICNYYLPIPFIYPLLLLFWLIPSLFLYCTEKRFLIAITSMFFLLGIAYEGVSSYLPHDNIAQYQPGRYALIGIVDSAVEIRKYSKKKTLTTFVMKVKKGKTKSTWFTVRGNVRVNVYSGTKPVQYGDEIRIWGEMKRPKRATNRGQFDYRAYLKKYDIHMIISAYGDTCVRIYSSKKKGGVVREILNVRNKINEKINRHIAYPYNTILSALLIGKRSAIPPSIRDDFVKTGTVHLLAISGLHVSIITAALYYVCTLFGMHRLVRAGVSILFMVVYAVLAGLRFPILRAVLMGSIIIMGIVLDRKKNLINTLFLVFLLLLLLYPESLFLAGFQLSFLSVFSIIILSPAVKELFSPNSNTIQQHGLPRRLRHSVHTGYAVSIAIFFTSSVLIIYYFNIFSLISIGANILIVPLSSAVMISGIIFVIAAFVFEIGAPFFAAFPYFLLKGMIAGIHLLSRIPFGFLYLKTPHLSLVLSYYFVLALSLFFKKKLFGRYIIIWIGIVWSIFVVIVIGCKRGDDVAISFLDAGRAPIVHIRSRNGKHIVINTGGGETSHAGRWILKPFLMAQGINSIDTVIITSLYKSYRGGINMLIDNFKVPTVLVPLCNQQYFSNVEQQNSTVIPIQEGYTLESDSDMTLTVLLGPRRREQGRCIDSALVLKLTYKDFKVLLCPLMDEDMFETLVRDQRSALLCDVLLVPHQEVFLGESEERFLKAVSPRIAIINGENQYHTQAVEDILTSFGCDIYKTGEEGGITISVSSNAAQWEVRSFLKNTRKDYSTDSM